MKPVWLARFAHRRPAIRTAILATRPGTSTITVLSGTFTVVTRTARFPDGRTWTFRVEAAAPHRLIAWDGPDGETGRRVGGERVAYWTLNHPGDESELGRLGLSPRPPRTP